MKSSNHFSVNSCYVTIVPISMRFEVFLAVSVTIMVFWDVTLCSLVDRLQHFEVTLVPICQNEQCHILEDCNLNIHL
jgi:hypothetical protein